MGARNYIIRDKGGMTPAVDGHFAVSGNLTVDGATTLTGASTLTGAITGGATIKDTTGRICTPAAIAADGTLAGKGLYVFNGASGNIHMPPVADYDGYTITVANQNGTGTATIVDDGGDGAPLIVSGATGASYALTPNKVVTLTAYATGTCWFGVS